MITFNYDLVVERATNGTIAVPMPHEAGAAKGLTRLLKLHGSVDWAVTREGIVRWLIDELPTLANPDLGRRPSIAIAGPGPSKRNMTRQPFQALWGAAEDALEHAHVIVFVGYRFPETDAEALQRLLTAISRNRETSLTARIVLGPNEQAPDVVRLRGLLRWALAGRTPLDLPEALRLTEDRQLLRGRPVISIEPLYSQDFLSVFQPELLDFRNKPRG